MNTNSQNTPKPAEQEIDLINLLRSLWVRRKTILTITGVCIVLGLLVAISSSKEYTASCEVVPQSNRNTANNSMARMASLAGINMGNLSSGEQLLSPMVYPNVLKSVAFQRELLQTQIKIKEETESITLLDYLSNKKYKKFPLTGTIKKYTIGLPGMIMKAIKGEGKTQEIPHTTQNFILLSKEEQSAIGALKKIVTISLEEKKGYITILVKMPEAYAAAQVAESTLHLLEKYITEFKIEKVQSNLEFIQERYDELKKEYEDIQMTRARYRDSYQNTSTSRARTELEKLDNQYSLAYSIFSEMATQLEQAKIQVKETTPVLTVISPVYIPTQPSKPRRMVILAGFTFLGVIAGCGYVLISPFLRETFNTIRRKEEQQ